MSSNIEPGAPPPEQPPAEAAPPAPEATPAPPRDEAGRFAALEPPVVQEPGLPQPPALPRVNADTAVEFYERLSNPQTRAEEFLRVGREYGFVPDGLTPDQVQEALLLYDDYQRQMGVQPAGPTGTPPLPAAPLPGGSPDQGWQPQGQPFDPEQFSTQLLDQFDQRQAQRDQERQVAEEQTRRVSNLQTAVSAVAESHGLSEVQAHGLLQQVALGIDTAVQQGRPVDFSAEALQAYGEQVFGVFAGMGRAAEQAQTQEAIAHHRQIAPQTTVPTGAPQSGAPGGPRGIRGVVDRINADRAARSAGG